MISPISQWIKKKKEKGGGGDKTNLRDTYSKKQGGYPVKILIWTNCKKIFWRQLGNFGVCQVGKCGDGYVPARDACLSTDERTWCPESAVKTLQKKEKAGD